MAVHTTRNGPVQIAYETFGPTGGRPLLLVMGLDSPMQWWPDGFCEQLADRGFRVARFDNRDCGQSTRWLPPTRFTRGRGPNSRREALRRALGRLPYTAADMVEDEVAVLDALGWPSAHVVGQSLGASLVMGLAIRHPERVRSVVTVMGLPAGFRPVAAARYLNLLGLLRFARLGTRQPTTPQDDVRREVEFARMLASPAHPFDEDWAYQTAQATRAAAPGDPGTAWRQLAAMRAGSGWLEHPERIKAPLLVLHGADDPLIRPEAAVALVQQVPGARSVMYAQMGHELPQHLWPEIADEIARHADQVPDTVKVSTGLKKLDLAADIVTKVTANLTTGPGAVDADAVQSL